MSDNQKVDVVIAGAGMVGSALAALLAKTGKQIAVVDPAQPKAWDNSAQFGLRVSALTEASRMVLERAGAWPLIKANRCYPYQRMEVWDHGSPALVQFDSAQVHRPWLGTLVENDLVVHALEATLDTLPNVHRIHQGFESSQVVDGGREVELSSGEKIFTHLLVGADGARSRVREHLDIPVKQTDYQQQGIVGVVELEGSHQSTCWQRFLPTGPLAFLPLSEGLVSIVWSADTEESERLMALSEEDFSRELSIAMGGRLGRVKLVSQRAAFPLRAQWAESYIAENALLVGDAGHVVHPLAGQGANLGFMDVAWLYQIVTSHWSSQGQPIPHALLRKYERCRRADNRNMSDAMTAFQRIFARQEEPVRHLRAAAFAIANNVPVVKQGIVKRAMGVSGDLPGWMSERKV